MEVGTFTAPKDAKVLSCILEDAFAPGDLCGVGLGEEEGFRRGSGVGDLGWSLISRGLGVGKALK